jgi:hypothetical protein
MIFQENIFKNDKAKYITPSWDQLDDLTLEVAKQVKHSGIHFDLVVALAKGAWPMSKSFVDYSGIKELASLGVKFYQGINKRLEKPEIYQQIPTIIKGKSILVFDDVADTGESLSFTKDYLKKRGAAKIKTATLFIKPWSILLPDFYGVSTETWIIFPFDKREMRDLLSSSWQKQGADQTEIINRLSSMGFSQEVLDL